MDAKQPRPDQLPGKRWPGIRRGRLSRAPAHLRPTIAVIEDVQTGNRPFGFARALVDEPATESIPGDGWDDHAVVAGGC